MNLAANLTHTVVLPVGPIIGLMIAGWLLIQASKIVTFALEHWSDELDRTIDAASLVRLVVNRAGKRDPGDGIRFVDSCDGATDKERIK